MSEPGTLEQELEQLAKPALGVGVAAALGLAACFRTCAVAARLAVSLPRQIAGRGG